MFTRLDDILYPNKVEVIHFEDKGKYIYPIFKNGKSSIEKVKIANDYKSLVNEQIQKINNVDVFLRDPTQRLISGIETYLWWNAKDRPWLDRTTIINQLAEGIIVDRHCLPQLHWIFNLARYLNPDALIHLHRLEMLVHYAGRAFVPEKNSLTEQERQQLLSSTHLQTILKFDKFMLENMTGSGWTVRQLLETFLNEDPVGYGAIIGRSKKLIKVFDVLS